MRYVSLEILENMGACGRGRRAFSGCFWEERIELSLENLRKMRSHLKNDESLYFFLDWLFEEVASWEEYYVICEDTLDRIILPRRREEVDWWHCCLLVLGGLMQATGGNQ